MENRSERAKFVLKEIEKGNMKVAYAVARETILLKVREEIENDTRKSAGNKSN